MVRLSDHALRSFGRQSRSDQDEQWAEYKSEEKKHLTPNPSSI